MGLQRMCHLQVRHLWKSQKKILRSGSLEVVGNQESKYYGANKGECSRKGSSRALNTAHRSDKMRSEKPMGLEM